MDVVYILGTGSLANNEEIRYSIRSLCENMLDLRNIYIVGEDPGFLKDFTHIPARDIFKVKWQNGYSKIRLAAGLPELSDEFLLMNDDFFMLDYFNGADWPFYALKDSNGGPDGIHSFHIHCPIRLKKEWYLLMPLDIEAKGQHSPRTFYANFYKAPPVFCTDFILRAGEGCRDFDEQVKDRPCFSIGDHAMLYPPFFSWLKNRYPEPSRFERSLLH